MSDELFASVNYIKNKVEAIEKIELLNLRSNDKLKEMYLSTLRSDNLLYKIYQQIDGILPQNEIARLIGTSTASVTNKIKILTDLGLVEIKEITTNTQKIYKHTIAEKAFNLSKVIK